MAGGAVFEVASVIRHDWRGEPVDPAEHVRVAVRCDGCRLTIDVDAPEHEDPAPASPAGSTDRLWEHEVVEVFFLGSGERYLEVELGPHGHHLVLDLEGRRRLVRHGLAIEYAARREGSRWTGRATMDAALLPPGLRRFNAYAISGVGTERRHLALHPVPGSAPDFHRLECFGPLDVAVGA